MEKKENALTKILKQKNISIPEIARRTNSPYSTLINASKKPVETWNILTLNKFAKGLGVNSGELLNYLQENTKLRVAYNDETLTIQGYTFAKKENKLYFEVKELILKYANAGYVPTKNELAEIINKTSDTNSATYQAWRKSWQDKFINELISKKEQN